MESTSRFAQRHVQDSPEHSLGRVPAPNRVHRTVRETAHVSVFPQLNTTSQARRTLASTLRLTFSAEFDSAFRRTTSAVPNTTLDALSSR